MNTAAASRPRILRLRQVTARTGLSRSSIYQLIHEKAFPKQIALTGYAVGWLESEVEQWIADKAGARA